MIVLGYHWLTCYNPSIDWVLGSNFFQQLLQHKSKSSLHQDISVIDTTPKTSGHCPGSSESSFTGNPMESLESNPLNAAVYSHTSKLKGSECFQLQISLPEVTGYSMTTSKILVDMSTVPKDYHDFADIFSKSKAGKLADHQP